MSIIHNKESQTFGSTVAMESIICCQCAIPFAVPEEYKRNLRRTQERFFCPNGHGQSYTKSTETILKEKIEKIEKDKEIEISILKNRIAYKEQLLQNKKSETIVLKRKNTIANNKLKRVKNGVCPCCNRSFENLQNHMKTQHPEILK